MEGYGFERPSGSGDTGSFQKLISRRSSCKAMAGALPRDFRTKPSLYRGSVEDFCDHDPFSVWNTEEGQDSDFYLEDPLDFQCANMVPGRNCFVGNIKELRRFRMEKHLDDFDQQLITRAKDAILKRNHAFKKIWEVKDFGESIDAQLRPNSGTVDWSNWPPPVPRTASGLNIPVEFYPEVEYDVRNPCDVKKMDMGFSARPQTIVRPDTFSHFKGVLNTHESTSFKVTPTSLIFPRAKLGRRYTGILKIQNQCRVPRRIGVVSPSCRFFDIIWGAELNEETVIPPGLTVKIIVHFKPMADVAINDVLTILVHNDGALVVPLLTSSESPPILEIDEFDCGCSTLNRTRISIFNIRNLSGRGRFWLMTEEDFAKDKAFDPTPTIETLPRDQRTSTTVENGEYEGELEVEVPKAETFNPMVSLLEPRKLSNYAKPSPPMIFDEVEGEAETHEAEVEGEVEVIPEPPEPVIRRKSSSKKEKAERKSKPRKIKPDTVYIKPFKLSPACFCLEPNEKIEIKAKFRPTEANFYYEKLVLVCDNGEVRWIALKGIGVDQLQQELVSVQGEWTGPPCDLPADLNTNLSMDCGDLLHGELAQRKFVLVNNSCIPLFFFWSIRTLRTNSPLTHSGSGLQHYLEGCVSADATGDEEDADDYNTGSQASVRSRCIRIEPSQGILSCHERLECLIKATAPELLGYHGCTVSLFIQQVDEKMQRLLSTRIASLNSRDLNSTPIYHDNVFPDLTNRISISDNSTLDESQRSSDTIEDITRQKSDMQRASVTKHTLSESVVLVPTPLFMDEAQNNDGNVDNDSSIEFYLATLRFRPNAKNALQLTGSGDSAEDSPNKYSLEDITLLEKKSSRRKNGRLSVPTEVSEVPMLDKPLQNINALQLTPIKEVEVWLRTVPMQCYFDPPFVIVSGTASSTLERVFMFSNQTLHPIRVSFDGTVTDICGIIFSPDQFTVPAETSYEFRIILHFEKWGKVSGELVGVLALPFTSVKCTLPFEVNCLGPCVEALTPLINFGLVCFEHEKVKTLAIKNTGFQKCTWRASISKTAMEDDEGHQISIDESSMAHNKLIRFWPDWGILEPEQFSGIQVYLTPSIHGKITTVIEIRVEGNPENVLCIPVWAEVQSPSLFLRNPNLILHNIFVGVPLRCGAVVLVNPTTFLVNFTWGPLLGSQKEFCRVSLKPNTGTVLPRRWVRIELTLAVDREMMLNNLFIPCRVDGMKEPLILQIEGTVSGPQVKIILPETYPSPINPMIEEPGESGEGGRLTYRRTGGYTAEDELTGEDGLASVKKALKLTKKQRLDKGTRKKEAKEGDDQSEKKRKKKKWVSATVMQAIDGMKPGKKRNKSLGASSKGTKDGLKVKRKSTIDPLEDLKSPSKMKIKGVKGLKATKKGKMKPLEEVNPESATLNVSNTDADEVSEGETKNKKLKKDRNSKPSLAIKRKDKNSKKPSLSTSNPSLSSKKKDKNKKIKGRRSTKTEESRLADDEEEMEMENAGEGSGEEKPRRFKKEYAGEHGCEDSEYPDLAPTAPTPLYPQTPLNTPEDLNKIYFQEFDGKRVNRRTFLVNNTSPMKAAFAFKVIRYPLNSWIDETKSPIENLIMRRMMSSSPYDVEARMFRDNCIAFEVSPRKGFVDPYASLEVSIILHTLSTLGTGKSIIYRDEIHCQVEGLPDIFIIKLEASVNSS